MTIQDPEVQLIVSIAATLEKRYAKEKLHWRESPFRWMVVGLPPATKGKVAEKLVARWCTHKGFAVTKPGDSDADLMISGMRVEVKLSTLWEGGVFKFQQFRDQDYDYGICLGISPNDVQCWVIPKDVLLEVAPPQHGGRRGSDTRWLSFPASDPPAWLDHYGGRLSEVHKIIATW